MANLPPRPKSPLPATDARDRERVVSTPMASRLRDDRPERPYVSRPPPPRSSDTYIPSYREGRREYDDRARDRYRDYDRRDRHSRDWSTLRRRRDSPDRDRRPPYRGPPRRRGPYYRNSRSRSPRRSSRSPRRYRSHSRSRSPSPRRSPKAARVGRHSVSKSPGSLSPRKRRSSRSRSRTPGYPPVQRPWTNERDSKTDTSSSSVLPPVKVEDSPSQATEHSTVKQEKDSSSSIHMHDQALVSSHLVHPPSDRPIKVEPLEPEDVNILQAVEATDAATASQQTKTLEPVVTKMDIDSPRLPPLSHQSPPKESRTPSMDEFSNRFSGIASRAPRSPPRGPRGYHSARATGPPPSASQHTIQPYPTGTRGSKRLQSTITPGDSKKTIVFPNGEFIEIAPKLSITQSIMFEARTGSITRNRYKLANEIPEDLKHLQRKMHELEMISMDLKAAEARRKLSEVHLEKAKNGTLGIDNVDDVETKN